MVVLSPNFRLRIALSLQEKNVVAREIARSSVGSDVNNAFLAINNIFLKTSGLGQSRTFHKSMNKESWMRGQQTHPLTIHFNKWAVSSDVSIQRAPLAAALSPFMSLLYPPNPWCEWCDVWRLTTTPGSTSPNLVEQWCEPKFFYVPQDPDKWKCCETGPTVFCPYPRRLESLTICRCHYKGSIFFSVI